VSRLYYMTTPHEHRGPYESSLNHVIDLLAKGEPWPVPEVGAVYTWECGGCTFRYLAGEWRMQTCCRRHEHMFKGEVEL
jgi:hypothetical protein